MDFALTAMHGSPNKFGVSKNRTAKEQATKIIDQLPEDSSFDDIVTELKFNRMVKRGLADVEAGRVISDEDMAKKIGSW